LRFADADADWGQGLIDLARWQDAHLPGPEPVLLAYFGNARPEDYGVRYRGLPTVLSGTTPDTTLSDVASPEDARGHVVVISRTLLTGSQAHLLGPGADRYGAFRKRAPDQ